MLNDSTAINGEKKTHAYIKEFLCSLEFQKPTDSKHYLIVYGEAWWQTSSKRIYFPFSLNNTKTKGPKLFQLCRFKQYNFKRSFLDVRDLRSRNNNLWCTCLLQDNYAQNVSFFPDYFVTQPDFANRDMFY